MAAARVVAYSITTQRGDGGCWFTVRNIDAAVANEEKLSSASKGLLMSGIRVIATETHAIASSARTGHSNEQRTRLDSRDERLTSAVTSADEAHLSKGPFIIMFDNMGRCVVGKFK